MDDLSAQLNQILSDPQSMQQIQGIINSLRPGGGEKGERSAPAPQPTPVSAPPAPPQASGFDPSALTGMLSALSGAQNTGGPPGPAQGSPLGGITPEMLGMVTKIAPLLNRVGQEDDSTRLLKALRPLLGEARRKKVDEALKILQMMRLLPLLKESGVFSGLLSGLL